MQDYEFSDEKDTMVITTKSIINNESDIRVVLHDEDDGMWQFLDGSDITEEDAAIVSLEEIVMLDRSINDVASMELGWNAYREKKGADWKIEKQ